MTGPADPGVVARVEAGGGRRDYPVLLGRGLLAELDRVVERYAPAHRYAVVADETVAGLYGEVVRAALSRGRPTAELFTFPSGERNKTREWWARLTDALLEHRYGRDAALVALGGGVTGDLAGFVAATYLRGIGCVQVPTSLVAMIDSSVGGKTGVDTGAGKNLVGAFHPPRVVVIDPDVAVTLPRAERSEGLAEAVKHGAILDRDYLGVLEEEREALLRGDPAATEAAVRRSVEIKAGIVSHDEKEGGLRQVLNFGHTMGHALEAAAGYRLSHGAAVSVGMVLEARLGEDLGVTDEGTSRALARILGGFGLPTTLPAGTDPARLEAFTRSDKKGRRGRPRWVLLRRLGEVAGGPAEGWSREVPPEAFEALLAARRTPGAAGGQ